MDAGADGVAVDVPALAVGSARRGVAGVGFRSRMRTLGDPAQHERVSRETCRASADRDVVYDVALRGLAAGSWTGLHALTPDASSASIALRADHAFRSAPLVGITLVFR